MADDLKIVDLHTHILPKMDDGSDSIETSLAILQTLWNDGVDVVCATSHYYRERETVEEFIERRGRSAASLRKAIRKVTKEGQESMAGNGLPVFFAGAETAFFSGISECDRLNDLCLEGTRTLMLEMPFREWTGMEHGEVISLVLDRGLDVILVHPERFLYSNGNKKLLQSMAELPVGLQVNADTLIDWRTRRTGLKLLKEAQIPLLGTDAHNMTTRAPHMKEARAIIAKKLGSGFLQQMDEMATEYLP